MKNLTKPTTKSKKLQNQVIPSPPQGVYIAFMLALLWLLPFVSINNTLDHTLVPRMVVLSVIIFVYLFVLWFWRRAEMPEMAILSRAPVWLWLLFSITGITSVVNAINPGETVFPIAKDFLFLFLLITTTAWFLRIKKREYFFTFLLVLVIANLVIGYFQYLTLAFRHVDMDGIYMVKGLMSHKNVFSGFIYATTPFLVYELFNASKGRRITFATTLFFSILFIMLLQTRAIWLGIALFSLLFVLSLLFIYRQTSLEQRKHLLLPGGGTYLAVTLLAFGIGWMVNDYSFSHPMNVRKSTTESQEKKELLPTGQRIASIADPTSENNKKRLEIWAITLDMIKDQPLIGHGAGNWKISAPGYYYEGYITTFFHNWRRPHNDFLWIAAERGIPALLFYLAFFVVLFIYTLRILLSKAGLNDKLLTAILMAGIAGYCSDAMVAFPYERIEQQLMFILLAAGIIALYHNQFPLKAKVMVISRKVFYFAALVVLGGSFWIGLQIWKAEENLNICHALLENGKLEQAVQYADLVYNPLYTVDAMNVPVMWFRGAANMRMKKFPQAALDFEHALKDSPHSIMVYGDLGVVYGELKRHQEAVVLFEKAYKMFPVNADLMKNLGVAYYQMNDYPNSLHWFQKCYFASGDTNIRYMVKELESLIAAKDTVN